MPSLTIPVQNQDHRQGSLAAPISLVEYGDYQCSACKMTVPIITQLEHELGNQLCFVFRHFPRKQFHPYALLAAKTAEAAGLQNQFWEMHHLLYTKQTEFNPQLWIKLAEELQLNMDKFKADFQSVTVSKKIEDEFMAGIRSGVNGTPCFYIQQNRYDGDLSYENLKQALIHHLSSQ